MNKPRKVKQTSTTPTWVPDVKALAESSLNDFKRHTKRLTDAGYTVHVQLNDTLLLEKTGILEIIGEKYVSPEKPKNEK